MIRQQSDALRAEIGASLQGGSRSPVVVALPEVDQGAADGQESLERSGLRPRLFDYQLELVEAMLQVVSTRSRAMLALPTGAGKTRTAIAGVLRCLAAQPTARVIWVAPSIELLEQARSALRQVWMEDGAAPDLRLTFRGVPSRDANIWFTTPHAMHQARHKPVWASDLVVFDEAHQLSAPTYSDAIERQLRGRESNRLCALVGLSATPGRVSDSETESLVDFFGGRLLTSRRLSPNPIEKLQRRGVLAKLVFHALDPGGRGNLTEGGRLGIAALRARDLSRRGGRVLVFTTSVEGSEALADALAASGVPALHVDGQLPEVERRRRIAAFAQGRVNILANQKLLSTGYDCPAVDHVILEGTIGSPIMFEQVVGRAARGPRTGGSPKAHIWQFVDHRDRHGVPKSYYRYVDFDWSC